MSDKPKSIVNVIKENKAVTAGGLAALVLGAGQTTLFLGEDTMADHETRMADAVTAAVEKEHDERVAAYGALRADLLKQRREHRKEVARVLLEFARQ